MAKRSNSWDGIDEPLLAFTLGYLTRIIDPRVEYKGVEEAVVDGAAAIKAPPLPLRSERETIVR